MEKKHIVLGTVVNATIVTTNRGVLVIDTSGSPEGANEVFEEAKRFGEVKYIINTHEHGDHLAGNHLYGCPIVSSSKALEAIAKNTSLAPTALPSITFDRKLTLDLGEPVELTHFGGHCPGAAVVYLPKRKLLLVGDLVFNGRVPYMGQADFKKWIASLKELEGWDAEVVVPGHGPVGGKEILTAQRNWLETFVRDVYAWGFAGLTAEDIFNELLARHQVMERWHPMLRQAIQLALKEDKYA